MRTRPAALLSSFALTGLVVLGAAGPAAAHGDTISFRIDGADAGHVRTVATWENDGDLVTANVGATLTAVSPDGQSAGPWPLVSVPGSAGTFTTREALPAGTWKVSVESAFPALGIGQGDVTVKAGPATQPAAPTRSTRVPAAAPAGRAADAAGAGGSTSTTVWIAAAAGVGVAGAAAVWAVRSRKRRAATA